MSKIEFLNHCLIEKKLSKNTIKAYRIDLNQFEKHLQTKHEIKYISDASKQHVKSFLVEINDYATKTIKRKIATLKAYYNFLEYEESIQVNPFEKIKVKIKVERTLPTYMTFEEVSKVFKTIYSRNHLNNNSEFKRINFLKKIAIIELLFTTGLRVSELCFLEKSNFADDFSYVRVKGKGNKERIIPICNQLTKDSLKSYYDRNKENIDLSNIFFNNRLNRRISDQSIRKIVKDVIKESGIQKHVTPHIFRHTFATLLLNSGIDIRCIQKLLGHSSIMVTQIYTHVSDQYTDNILSKKHPRNNISA